MSGYAWRLNGGTADGIQDSARTDARLYRRRTRAAGLREPDARNSGRRRRALRVRSASDAGSHCEARALLGADRSGARRRAHAADRAAVMTRTRFLVMTAPIEVLLTDGSFRALADLERFADPPMQEFASFDAAEQVRASFGPMAPHLIVVEVEEGHA